MPETQLADPQESVSVDYLEVSDDHPFAIEVIERQGAKTFGGATVEALHEAVERERTGERGPQR
jgi:4-hydroxyphenylpyruvate dioxygenase-like putative hemolysin